MGQFQDSDLQRWITDDSYELIHAAANMGNLHIMNSLIQLLTPEKVQDMIASRNYAMFREAVQKRHEHIIERLIELAPEKVQDLIANWDYLAFRTAAANGDERLIELAPDKVQAMIASDNYGAFRWAAGNGHKQLANRLLEFSSVFAYAELHQHEYGARFVQPFIAETIKKLMAEKHQIEQENPHAVFDISDAEKAKSCFYILRNLIDRNDPALLDDIRFFLNIPAVKALVHTAVTAEMPNELLRLALSRGNQAAAEVLLTIPAVYDLARQNNFYNPSYGF